MNVNSICSTASGDIRPMGSRTERSMSCWTTYWPGRSETHHWSEAGGEDGRVVATYTFFISFVYCRRLLLALAATSHWTKTIQKKARFFALYNYCALICLEG